MSQKLIKVKTPLTTNGTDPVIGSDGRQVYIESILTAVAKPILEKANQALPQHLKKLIEDYDGPAGVKAPEGLDETAAKELKDLLEGQAKQAEADRLELEELRALKAKGQLGSDNNTKKDEKIK